MSDFGEQACTAAMDTARSTSEGHPTTSMTSNKKIQALLTFSSGLLSFKRPSPGSTPLDGLAQMLMYVEEDGEADTDSDDDPDEDNESIQGDVEDADAEVDQARDDDEDECDNWGGQEAQCILDSIIEQHTLLNGTLRKSISCQKFYDLIWNEFKLACRHKCDEEELGEVCNMWNFAEYLSRRRWRSYAKMFNAFESSYVKDGRPSRYLHRFTLDYERCTLSELKHFVNQRGLKDPYRDGITLKYCYIRELENADQGVHLAHVPYKTSTTTELKQLVSRRGLQDPYPDGVTLKYCYVRMLKEADRIHQFDLIGLPPELRIRIYQYALCLQVLPIYLPGTAPICPNLLRVSKFVYKEARSALYDDNVFKISFSASEHGGGEIWKSGLAHMKLVSTPSDNGYFFRFPYGIDDYPEFLRRISRLRVKLSCHARETVARAEATKTLNHFIATLASFLMDGHQLKHLHFEFHIPEQVCESAWKQLVYPLRRLRNIQKITFAGSMPAFITEKLREDLSGHEPVFNTMRIWQLLHHHAMLQLRLGELTNGECTCGECACGDCVCQFCSGANGNLIAAISRVSTKAAQGFIGSHNEEQMIAELALLRKAVFKFDFLGLKEIAQGLSLQNKAIKTYESVTDEGRLEEALKIWAHVTPGHTHSRSALKTLADVPAPDDWNDV